MPTKDEVLARYRSDFDPKTCRAIRDLWKHHSVCEDNRDVEGILTTLSDDAVYEIVNTEYVWKGKAGCAQFYRELLTAIPDAKFELQQIVIGPQGVFEEAILSGHHRGDFRDRKATGNPIRTTVGIYFPWKESEGLFSGERVYVNVDSVFGA